MEDALIFLNRKYKGVFEFDKDNLIKGRTGGPGVMKCQTAFGFALIGKGRFEGNVFLLFRGTQYLADWLTNLNVTVSRSACGHPVHDGFNAAFLSMQPMLKAFLSAVPERNRSSIHCIGHSLGGAVATMCAGWVADAYAKRPYLYTFGSPRVGLVEFSSACTKSVGCDHIFRVYHKTDIVPFIPVWPFAHTPNNGPDYYLPSPGVLPSAECHGMVHYIDSVRGQSWRALGALKSGVKSDEDIARWLKQHSPAGITMATIEWLNHALVYVLKKCLSGAEWFISSSFSTSFTLMDKLAYILSEGVKLAENISSWVIHLIRKIMRILGYGHIVDASEVTRSLVRAVLLQLQQRLNRYAKDALSQALVEGRAI